MFQLTRVHDVVHIQPYEFGRDVLTAVRNALNAKYPNKVMRNLGLCVALYDILHIGESHLHPGSAAHHTAVQFRLVIFRPHIGEILTGSVVSSDEEGVRISLGFFNDIHVPKTLLQEPSSWSPEEGLWVWNVTPEHELFVDLENPIRFRVHQIVFAEQGNAASRAAVAATAAAAVASNVASRPGTPGAGASTSALAAKTQAAGGGSSGAPAAAPPVAVEPPMRIIAAIDKAGLGLTSWWPGDEGGDDADGGEGITSAMEET